MFKRKKKKTGVQTPDFRNPTPPPPPPNPPMEQPQEDHHIIRTVRKALVDTEEKLHILTSNSDYAHMLKIENADVYWNDKNGAIIVVTTSEWRDYLTGQRDTPFIEKENNKCKD